MAEPATAGRVGVDAGSVVDRVTIELRRAIITGTLPPGQEFSLRQIASQLGSSFIPVREALRTLEADGLLITRRGRSAVVAPLDLDGLLGISRLRRLIEPELSARACLLMPPVELDGLEARIGSASPPLDDADALLRDHVDFHARLLRPAATDWDLRILDRLWQGATRYLYHGYRMVAGQWDVYQPPGRTQRELIAAFRAKEPDRARAAAEHQLDRDEAVSRLGIEHLVAPQLPARSVDDIR